MAARVLFGRGEQTAGQYRILTGFVQAVSHGDYVVTGYSNVYSVSLTLGPNAAASSFSVGPFAALHNTAGGGTVTFLCPVSKTPDFYVQIWCN